MSQIPFVKLLGDELERAAERVRPQPKRPWRRRRLGLLAVGGAVLVSGTALATGLLSGDVERQAIEQIACYDGADPDFSGSVAVMAPEAGTANASPVELCRRELSLNGQPAPPLVACAKEAAVAVIPGRDPAACAAAGFAPLDRGYVPARARAAQLERRILAVETSADCIPPRDMARRVQTLLDRSGWAGWTARVRPGRGAGGGPCGSVSAIGGDGRRYISGLLDADARRVSVVRGAARRVTDLLHSADRSLLVPLFEESGARCFSYAGLVDRIEQVFAAEGIDASVYGTPHPRSSALDDEDGRWTRYQAGCAVLAGGAPGATPDSAVIQVFQK
jgi:hypothetical protein